MGSSYNTEYKVTLKGFVWSAHSERSTRNQCTCRTDVRLQRRDCILKKTENKPSSSIIFIVLSITLSSQWLTRWHSLPKSTSCSFMWHVWATWECHAGMWCPMQSCKTVLTELLYRQSEFSLPVADVLTSVDFGLIEVRNAAITTMATVRRPHHTCSSRYLWDDLDWPSILSDTNTDTWVFVIHLRRVNY